MACTRQSMTTVVLILKAMLAYTQGKNSMQTINNVSVYASGAYSLWMACAYYCCVPTGYVSDHCYY